MSGPLLILSFCRELRKIRVDFDDACLEYVVYDEETRKL